MLIKGLNVTQQMVDTCFIYTGILVQPAKNHSWCRHALGILWTGWKSGCMHDYAWRCQGALCLWRLKILQAWMLLWCEKIFWMGQSFKLIFPSPFSVTKKLSSTSLSILRSTWKEPSWDKNTMCNEAVHWQIGGQHHFQEHVWFFPSLGKWLTQQSCWTLRWGGVKALGLFHLRIQKFNPFWVLGIWRLMASWYVSPPSLNMAWLPITDQCQTSTTTLPMR